MGSSKTNCTQCGTEILQITADLTEGHCMPCANKKARAKEPVSEYVRRKNPEPLLNHLSPSDGVVISVSYHPGFTPDLTSWTIQIKREGEFRQAVQWYRHSSREEELLDPIRLDQSQMAKLEVLIDRFDSCALEDLEQAACVDDAANISMIAPLKGIRSDLPYFHFIHFMKKGLIKFSDSQRVTLSMFGDLWRFIDQSAPYSLHEHEKGRTKGS